MPPKHKSTTLPKIRGKRKPSSDIDDTQDDDDAPITTKRRKVTESDCKPQISRTPPTVTSGYQQQSTCNSTDNTSFDVVSSICETKLRRTDDKSSKVQFVDDDEDNDHNGRNDADDVTVDDDADDDDYDNDDADDVNGLTIDQIRLGWTFGVLYIMFSLLDILKRIYIGITMQTLNRRKSQHMDASKDGTSKWHVFMREFPADSWMIEKVKLVKFEPGMTTAAKRARLKDHEKKAINNYNGPGPLLNTTLKEGISKRVTTIKNHTIEEKRLVASRKKDSRNDRGSVKQMPSGNWRFQWTPVNDKRKTATFTSHAELIVFQKLKFPETPVYIAPEAELSYVYGITSPHLPYIFEEYRGKTTLTPAQRMSHHRAKSRKAAKASDTSDRFHKFMGDNQPSKWEIFPIHTLYDVTAEELWKSPKSRRRNAGIIYQNILD